MAFQALRPNNSDLLLASRCLSCNRPLGSLAPPSGSRPPEEWYTGAGKLGGPKDRIMEATIGGVASGGDDNKGGGDGCGEKSELHGRNVDAVGSFVTSKAPGQTQSVVTPGKIMPTGTVEAIQEAGKKTHQGPLLFERTSESETTSTQRLKGRALRGGAVTGAEANISISKVWIYLWQVKRRHFLQEC